MSSVQYWKFADSIPAKILRDKDGSLTMRFEGEKEPFPTFPRGHLLFGNLSKLKHEIKVQIFNESWAQLEEGKERKEVIKEAKRKFFSEIADIGKSLKYDMLPEKSMCPAVREIYRAWTKVGGDKTVRDILTFILQEDDGYRNRFQWMISYFNPNSWWVKLARKSAMEMFDDAFGKLEHGEVINDMKERVRLVRRIIMLLLEDKDNWEFFERFYKEVDWNKVKLSEADKYHFRGKYFKVDWPYLTY